MPKPTAALKVLLATVVAAACPSTSAVAAEADTIRIPLIGLPSPADPSAAAAPAESGQVPQDPIPDADRAGIASLLVASRTPGGQFGDGSSFLPVFAPDGRVAFVTLARNFAAGDGFNTADIYLKNLNTGALTLVSRTPAGRPGNGNSGWPTFPKSAGLVAFSSVASDLVAGDSNGQRDIFLRNLTTGRTTIVSRAANGAASNGESDLPAFSPDGKLIAFSTLATNLRPGDTNNSADVVVKTLATGAIRLVSANAQGRAGTGASLQPSFSSDGKRIVFVSAQTILVPGDTNGFEDCFVKTLATGAVRRVNVSRTGVQGNGPCVNPVFSPDGRKVAFVSNATNLTAVKADPDTGSPRAAIGQVFVKDLTTGAVVVASAKGIVQGNGASGVEFGKPAFSPDGTRIAFSSFASNLVTGDSNARSDIFLRNLATGTLNRISVGLTGAQGTNNSYAPAFAPTGGRIAFETWAGFTAGDVNFLEDVYVVTPK